MSDPLKSPAGKTGFSFTEADYLLVKACFVNTRSLSDKVKVFFVASRISISAHGNRMAISITHLPDAMLHLAIGLPLSVDTEGSAAEINRVSSDFPFSRNPSTFVINQFFGCVYEVSTCR